jgi:hypothetical protein
VWNGVFVCTLHLQIRAWSGCKRFAPPVPKNPFCLAMQSHLLLFDATSPPLYFCGSRNLR